MGVHKIELKVPFVKRAKTLEVANLYVKGALSVYLNAEATIIPIDEPEFKFKVLVNKVDTKPSPPMEGG